MRAGLIPTGSMAQLVINTDRVEAPVSDSAPEEEKKEPVNTAPAFASTG